MRSSAELKQELDQYKKYAKKKIDKLKGAWLHAIKYEEEHPSPEVLMQEAMMTARIDKFRKHKWKPGDTFYKARYSSVEGALMVRKCKIKAIADNKLVTTIDGLPFDPTEVTCDDLAAIAMFYFKAKDMSIPDKKLFYDGGKLTRYQFRRYVREWYFEVKADLEKQHESH